MKKTLYATVDIGGTKLLLVLIDGKGRVVVSRKAKTPYPSTPPAVTKTVKDLLAAALDEAGTAAVDPPQSLGVCFAGFIDPHTALVHQGPNLGWTEPVALADLLSESLSLPVILENDANAAVVGEVYYGAARGHKNVIYITLSTGIGGGLFLDGQLYRGANGFAGEIGHTKSYGRNRSCSCGGRGCLEAWASGQGMTRSAATLWPAGEAGGSFDTAWIFKRASAGDALAIKIIDEAARDTGTGLANLVNILNPTCMVIGGGVAAGGDGFFEQVSRIIKEEAIRPAVATTPLEVVASALEPEAGIWGMYALLTGLAR